ncbi:MAG: hypothetical protein GKC09_10805, partial [Methanosarcinales archaeon]|nr:hypothetical protein [Methanosarcinales archaeon]
YPFSMFLLGEYYEDEAREIADRLKDVGMKVDIRMVTTSYLDVEHFLEGRMSELKGILEEEDYARYERYLAVLRKVIAEGAGPEDLLGRIEMEMDPQIDDKRNQLAEAFFSDEDLTEEERQAKGESLSCIKEDVLDVYKAISFIDLLIDRNDIKVEDDIASKLDDPIIRVIDDNYDEEESDLARMTISFSLEPKALVFVDELSSLLAEKLEEEFEEEYENEFQRLFFLGKLISELEEPSPEKMDMESFRNKCQFAMEKKGDIIEIDGSEAAEELARSLEKSGIIKVKGDSIKWKR